MALIGFLVAFLLKFCAFLRFDFFSGIIFIFSRLLKQIQAVFGTVDCH